MFQSAANKTSVICRRDVPVETLDAGFRLRRPRRNGMRRLLAPAAAVVALAAILGSVTVSAETRQVSQPAAQPSATAQVAEAPQPRRAVRIIQIYNLPAR